MRIRPKTLDVIARGDVTLAFRRWDRPRVRVGTRMRTAIGLVEVMSVEPTSLAAVTPERARAAGHASRAELARDLSGRDGRLYAIGLRYAGPDPRIALRERADLDDAAVAELRGRLERLDAASRHGAWTRSTLELIAERPEVRAPDLAASVGRPVPDFKRDVRKLKELGLTESLPVGYRISPRGRALLDRLGD